MSKRVLTKDLVYDSYIYPRKNKSQKTVETYAESMRAGAEFPPIKVQRVVGYPESEQEVYLIIDGMHRLGAYEVLEIEDVEIQELDEHVWVYEEDKARLALASAYLNTQHGDRLSEGDKKSIARQLAADDPEQMLTEQQFADSLGVPRQTISDWISDIRARQRASRDSLILRLSLLGWTQKEIAGVVGLDQSVISRIMQNADIGILHNSVLNMLDEGRDMAWIADALNMDMTLAWTLRLLGKTDHDRFKALEWGLRTWDLWNFNDVDDRFGEEWPGRIPAQLVAHTLYFFTKAGNLIMDPMAGGGVVPDVCLAFERRCRSFDLATRTSRPEIQKYYWGLDSMQWPDIKKPDLLFFDPPYFSKKKEEYEDKFAETNESESVVPVSSLSRVDYLRFFEQFFILAAQNCKPTTRVAFLNADWRDYSSVPASKEKPDTAITLFDYHSILTKTGWQITHRIECPMSSQRLSGALVSAMQDSRILGTVGRTLLIARRKK